MTQPPLAPPGPSWTPIVLVGAALTVFLWLLPDIVAAVLPGLFPGTHLCCCLYAFPLGVVPALLAASRDPALSPGQGFAVSFIAVGLGSLLIALRGVLTVRDAGRVQLEEGVRKVLESWNERVPDEQKLTGEALEQSVAFWAAATPYVPVLLATILTVFAGLLGMATVSYLRSRRPRPPFDVVA